MLLARPLSYWTTLATMSTIQLTIKPLSYWTMATISTIQRTINAATPVIKSRGR